MQSLCRLLASILQRQIEVREKGEKGKKEAVRRGMDKRIARDWRELRKKHNSRLTRFLRHERLRKAFVRKGEINVANNDKTRIRSG